jgi:hypothetical protein
LLPVCCGGGLIIKSTKATNRKGLEMTFTNMVDATEYVEMALGEFAADYDTEAIARDCTEWHDGQLVLMYAGDEFWQIVEMHAC